MFTNCHGSVFADGLYNINNDQVATILQDDYTAVPDGQSKPGDVVVYWDATGLAHSATVTEVDEAGNPLKVSSVSGTNTTNEETNVAEAWKHPHVRKVFRENEEE
jgi:hypothetical protein